jgi:hypothetical protein
MTVEVPHIVGLRFLHYRYFIRDSHCWSTTMRLVLFLLRMSQHKVTDVCEDWYQMQIDVRLPDSGK